MEERKKCNCKWTKCARHGDCDACRAHHKKMEKHPLPFCESKRKKKDPDRPKAHPDLEK